MDGCNEMININDKGLFLFCTKCECYSVNGKFMIVYFNSVNKTWLRILFGLVFSITWACFLDSEV